MVDRQQINLRGFYMLDFNLYGPEAKPAINDNWSFQDEMRKQGLAADCEVIADGRLHRYTVQGDKAKSNNGWYVLHVDVDFSAGAFGSWKTGEQFNWCSRSQSEMSDAEREAYRKRMDELKRLREAEQARVQKGCEEWCARAWSEAKPATADHLYLKRKGVQPHGLRLYKDSLMVPVYDSNRKICGIQFISPDGTKKFKTGSKLKGGFDVLPGTGNAAKTVVLCEGFATAASINEATGYIVYIAFNAGNLIEVAKQFKPDIIAADNDHKTEGNPGLTKAHEAAKVCGARVVYPTGIQGTDFNDLHCEKGIEAVRACFDGGAGGDSRFKLLRRDDIKSFPPLNWIVKGILPSRGMAQMFGPSRAGKSFLSFDMGCAIAEGREWFGYRVKQRPVVYIMLEGEGGLKQRMEAWEEHNCRRLPDEFMAVTQSWGITIEQDVSDIAAVIPQGSVIFVDTQNRAAPMVNENSSEDMGQIIEGAKRLERMVGGIVVLVAHTGKDTTKGVRGHSSQIAAVDASIEVTRVGEQRTWRADKVKDGLDGKEHPFKLRVVELGHDDDGDAITSCVIDVTDCDAMVNMTGMEKMAVDALMKASAMAKIPREGMWGATVEDWRIEFTRNRGRDKGDKEVKKDSIDRSFRRATDDLVAKGIVSPVGNIMVLHGGSYQDDIITMMSMPFGFNR